MLLFVHTAPSAPPQYVSAIPESSTSITVSWEPPSLEDRNGYIILYRLNYSSEEKFASGGSLDVSASNTMMVVIDLEEFIRYSFFVAAETSKGIGPFSDPVNATTFQDGTY